MDHLSLIFQESEDMPKITSNGVELNYIREGSGDPVLLAHGLLFDAEHWRPQVDALKGAYDVIAVDLRGQGSSSAPTDQEGYSLWNQAEDVFALLRELGVGPVHWVGLSMGGMIGMRMALLHPEVLRSLVLIDTTSHAEEPDKVERYEAFRQVVEGGGMEHVLPGLPPIFFKDSFIASRPDAVEGWFEMLRRSDHGGVGRASRGVDQRDDITARLGEIKLPTLVIHGTEDAAIELEKGEELARLIPGAQYAVVDGAGHQSNVDSPDQITALVKDFLAAVPASV